MKHQLNMITLGVNDLAAMSDWYRDKFGWLPLRNSEERTLFAIGNFILVLVHANKLAKDICVWQDGNGFKKFALTIQFPSEQAVDRIFSDLRNKRVTIVKEPQEFIGGAYKGYIADPEDNFWELAFYPFIEFDETSSQRTQGSAWGFNGQEFNN